jgi:hypothetical protein
MIFAESCRFVVTFQLLTGGIGQIILQLCPSIVAYHPRLPNNWPNACFDIPASSLALPKDNASWVYRAMANSTSSSSSIRFSGKRIAWVTESGMCSCSPIFFPFIPQISDRADDDRRVDVAGIAGLSIRVEPVQVNPRRLQ